MTSSKQSLGKKAFNLCIRAQGRFNADLVFSTPEEVQQWLTKDLPEIEKKGPISLYIRSLNGLKVGDTCFVMGEGMDKFKIEEIRQNGDYRYSFGVNNCWENVAKCHTQLSNKKETIDASFLKLFDVKNLKKLKIKSSIHYGI